jgi:hypothetical protein
MTDTEEPAWSVEEHVASVLAEAMVAEAIWRHTAEERQARVLVMRPRHRGFDVRFPDADDAGLAHTIDAKVAEVADVAVSDRGPERSIGWNAGGREPLLHDQTCFLGLVLLERSELSLRSVDEESWRMRATGDVAARVWIVPRDVALTARPIWASREDAPGNGWYRYLPLAELSRFEWRPSRPGAAGIEHACRRSSPIGLS